LLRATVVIQPITTNNLSSTLNWIRRLEFVMALSKVWLLGATNIKEIVQHHAIHWQLWDVTAAVVIYADQQSVVIFDFKQQRVHHVWDTGAYECYLIRQMVRADDNPRIVIVQLLLEINRYTFYYPQIEKKMWGKLEQLVLYRYQEMHTPIALVRWMRNLKERLQIS